MTEKKNMKLLMSYPPIYRKGSMILVENIMRIEWN